MSNTRIKLRRVKNVEMPCLSPHLTNDIKYYTKDAHLMDRNVGVCSQFLVFPNSLCKPDKCGRCLSYSLVDLRVQGEVISDGRVEIGDLMD